MQLPRLITVIVLILSLLIQAVILAAAGMQATAYKDLDEIGGTTTIRQTHQPCYIFILTASAFSVLLYIYLLIVKLTEKTPSLLVDWFVIHTLIILQFAIAVTLAIYLTTTKREYDTYMATLDVLNAAGTENDTSRALTKLKQTRALSMAACIIAFVISFFTTFVVFAWNYQKHREVHPVDTHNTSGAQIEVK